MGGYTHFSKPVGVEGLYVGAKGSEVLIQDASGNVYAGTAGLVVADGSGVRQTYSLTTAGSADSSAASIQYVVSPVAGTVSGYVVSTASDGTGRTVTVTVGSAGAVLLEAPAAFLTSNGTIGKAVAMTNTSGTTTITAGQSMLVSFGSCATAQRMVCNVFVTRTS